MVAVTVAGFLFHMSGAPGVTQTSKAPRGAADSALPVHLTLPYPEGDLQLSGHACLSLSYGGLVLRWPVSVPVASVRVALSSSGNLPPDGPEL